MPAKLIKYQGRLAYRRTINKKPHISFLNPALDAQRTAKQKYSQKQWKKYPAYGDKYGSKV